MNFFSCSLFQGLEITGKKTQEDPKMLHYILMKNKSAKMAKNCENFFFILPDIRTDFEIIPTEGYDRSYVEEWLAANLKKSSTLLKSIEKMLKNENLIGLERTADHLINYDGKK